MQYLAVQTCSWSSEEPSSNSRLPHCFSASPKANHSPMTPCFPKARLPLIYYIGFCAISKVSLAGKEASIILYVGQSPRLDGRAPSNSPDTSAGALMGKCVTAVLRQWITLNCSSSALYNIPHQLRLINPHR